MNNFKVISVLFILMALVSSCKRETYKQVQGIVWNTSYHITYECDRDLSDSIIAELKKVELSVSAFSPVSVVTKINRNEEYETDTIFREVYYKSREVWKETDGAFDPTLAPLINAYGFGYEEKDYPSDKAIDSILLYVGIDKTALQGNVLKKEFEKTEFNFSAIAKGYGCDRVGRMFKRNGIKNFMIEIGGEVVLSGNNPSGKKWNISIDKPVFSSTTEIHDSQMVIAVTDCGMATSGNYRNYKEVDGKRIAHTLDRFTGRPVMNDLLSVTIIAPTCMEADAYATACMSMGSVKAKKLVGNKKLAAMFVLSDGSIYTSPAFPKAE